MKPIACLPMYDWPECRGETDARWARLRDSLKAHGIAAPETLTRTADPEALWLDPGLLLGETCAHPLATVLDGRVRYVATPVHDVEGCSADGTYRSVIIRCGKAADRPVPADGAADLPELHGKLAANAPNSLSGYVALKRDAAALPEESAILWTGSHRASVIAVASGQADHAAIDCVSFWLARRFEPAAANVMIAGWTAARPALPLITALTTTDEALALIRKAVLDAIPAVVLDNPTDEPQWRAARSVVAVDNP